MNKKSTIILCILCLFIFVYVFITDISSHPSPNMTVARSFTETYEDGYVQNLSIILSDSSISDYETCAWDIINHCIQNTFYNIEFSYDVTGYPSRLNASVYLSESDFSQNKALFHFSYQTSGQPDYTYDIFHHKEHYYLTIQPNENNK